jgi:integrase
MKNKFWLCRRGRSFYSFDSETGTRKSLGTNDRNQAKQIIGAKNESIRQPSINLAIAKAYLVGVDPKLIERTWQTVMDEYSSKGKPTTQARVRRALKNEDFDSIRHKPLVETTGDDFWEILKIGGAFTQHMLRRLHNLAVNLGWILVPIVPPKLWPKTVKKTQRAITSEEHQNIIEGENQAERRNYYQMLWEIGSGQTDAANLTTSNIDWNKRLLSYRRQKTAQLCLMQIGSRLEKLLKSLPAEGSLFPGQKKLEAKDRAAEFRRRCQILRIDGISLHSYRYAWAERAKCLGLPERFAQSALGHASLAVHREYARDGVAICPSLEAFEVS